MFLKNVEKIKENETKEAVLFMGKMAKWSKTNIKQTDSLLGRKENNYTKGKQGDKPKRKKKRNEKKRPSKKKFKNK